MITFKEDTHEYFNGDKKLISVTQLMQKHGLAPSYDGVPSEVLNRKAERGTLIHKEIEDYVKNGEIGFTTEFTAFKEYLATEGIEVVGSEFIVYNDVVAGTVDLLLEELPNLVIADIKTTSTLHKEAVSWQLSIYAYLYMLGHETGIENAKAFHFDKDGNLNVVDIPLKPMTEVEKLLECERNGEIYQIELPAAVKTQLTELAAAEQIIKTIELQKKEAEANAQKLRDALMQAMEENSVTTFENDAIKLTYVAPSTRTSIDSTKLKKELPDIAEKYTKTSQVKASLRITLKEEEQCL